MRAAKVIFLAANSSRIPGISNTYKAVGDCDSLAPILIAQELVLGVKTMPNNYVEAGDEPEEVAYGKQESP